MSEIIKPRVLKGFRDFLPEQEHRRKLIQSAVERVFARFGFVPIDTPVLEYTDILLGKGGGETDKQVYRFQDKGGRDVAMRFDLTVPFARYMAQHRSELYLPFKRYHIGKVFRGENTQRGRYREFMQCDFDIVGVDSASADFDILLVIVRSLEELGLRDFRVHLSHRGVFNRFLERLGLTDASVEILRTVDKLRKLGPDKTRAALCELTNEENAESILTYINITGTAEETLEQLRTLVGSGVEEITRLESIYRYAGEAGLAERVRIDPSITRGLDYYTGTVYETFLDRLEGIGSICSGGRYNDLASLYTRERIPGVGASIGLDRLMAALEELEDNRAGGASACVLVVCVDDELTGHYHLIAEQFRTNGLPTEVYPEKRRLSTQFDFAEKKGIPLAVICGGEEHEANAVNLKDLRSRESFEGVSIERAVEKAHELLQ